LKNDKRGWSVMKVQKYTNAKSSE